MSRIRPIELLAFFALGAISFVAVAHFAWAPEPVAVAAGPGATSNHDPARPVPPLTAETVVASTPIVTAEPVVAAQPIVAVAPVATAELVPSVTTVPAALRAEPEPAAPAASAAPAAQTFASPSFFSVDTTLYARDNARLRAAPSMTADVTAKLAAGAPLHAIKRATDGAWWQVSLADGRTGYISRAAASKERIAKATPPEAAPAPVAAAAPPPPVAARPEAARGSRDMLGYVDEAMNWFTDAAARGRTPAAKPTER